MIGRTGRFLVIAALLGAILFSPFGPKAASAANLTPAYVFPLPDSTRLNPQTSIIVRYEGAANAALVSASSFMVIGQASGAHPGRVALSDDGATVTFTPDQPFAAGEAVHVSVTPVWVAQNSAPYTFTFTVNPQPRPQPAPASAGLLAGVPAGAIATRPAASPSPDLSAYLTLPANFPPYTVDLPAAPDNYGYYFTSPVEMVNWFTYGYALIMDSNGEPVFYINRTTNIIDFKKQPNGLLSFYNDGAYYLLDSSYQQVDRFTAQNGYVLDVHDLLILPNNHAVFMIYDTQVVDMSQIVPGGDPQANVIGLVIQELDGNRNVVFEWRSWDHFQITDAVSSVDLTAHDIDYVHGNAIELDWDGNYLISSRHLCEITKIDRRTGAVLWRLGGENNQFTFTNVDISASLPFSHQHDIRRLDNGNITIFDNRNNLTPLYSSATEYWLNEDTKTITKVWEYHSEASDDFSAAMGNAQRLDNGNTVIGWGLNANWLTLNTPDITEVKPDGSKAFEMTFGPGYLSYRAFRFDWHGYPTWPPAVVFRSQPGQITVGVSWNGATEVSRYELYAAASLDGPLALVSSKPKAGFETQWTINDEIANYCYFQARAYAESGALLGTSGRTYNTDCMPYKSRLPIASR